MIMGTMDLKMRSGLRTPMLQIPTPDLAVPYAAPRSKEGYGIVEVTRDHA